MIFVFVERIALVVVVPMVVAVGRKAPAMVVAKRTIQAYVPIRK